MSARSRILDAYTSLLIEEGDRGATLDAVAARAGLSKGGVLYHFPSTDALAEALVELLNEKVDLRRELLISSPQGVAAAHVNAALDLDRAHGRLFAATSRLSSRSHPRAALALQAASESTFQLIRDQVGDDVLASVILALGNGLSYRAMLERSGVPSRTVGMPEEPSAAGATSEDAPGDGAPGWPTTGRAAVSPDAVREVALSVVRELLERARCEAAQGESGVQGDAGGHGESSARWTQGAEGEQETQGGRDTLPGATGV